MSSREFVVLAFLCSCCGNRSGSDHGSSGSANVSDHGDAGVVYEDSIPESEELMGISHEGNWGYVNRRGELVIPFQFVSVSQFKDGRAVAEVSGEDWSRFKYIDKAGKVTGDFAPPKNKTSFAAGDMVYGNMPEGVYLMNQPDLDSETDGRARAGKGLKLGKNFDATSTSTVNMFKGKWLPVDYEYNQKKWVLDLFVVNFNPNCEAARCETWIVTRSNKADESYSQSELQKFSSGALSLRTTGWEWMNGKATFPGLSIGQVVLYYFMANPGLSRFKLNYSLEVDGDKKDDLTFSVKKDPKGNIKSMSLSTTSPDAGNSDFEFVQEANGVSVTESFASP